MSDGSILTEALNQLEANRLEVVLIPSQDPECAMRGGKIRVVQTANATWYRKFCAQHPSNARNAMRRRKFQTKIKRAHTRRALMELLSGKCQTYYAQVVDSFLCRNTELLEDGAL